MKEPTEYEMLLTDERRSWEI